jgi:hypothetical protein
MSRISLNPCMPAPLLQSVADAAVLAQVTPVLGIIQDLNQRRKEAAKSGEECLPAALHLIFSSRAQNELALLEDDIIAEARYGALKTSWDALEVAQHWVWPAGTCWRLACMSLVWGLRMLQAERLA